MIRRIDVNSNNIDFYKHNLAYKRIDNEQNKTISEKKYADYNYASTALGKAGINFKGNIKITPEQVKRLVAEYTSGKSITESVKVLLGMGVAISISYAHLLLHSQTDWDEIKKQHIYNNQTDKTIISEDLKQAIIKDYSEGEVPVIIAKKYGVAPITIRRIVKKEPNYNSIEELHSKNNKATYKPIPKEVHLKAKELYLNGMSAAAIAQILGCSPACILSYLSKQDDYNEIKKIHIQNNQTEKFVQTPKIMEKAVAEYRSGKQIYLIAKELNCSPSPILEYLKQQANYEELKQEHIRNNQGKKSIISDDMIQKMVELYRTGITCKNIAKKFGCEASTVGRYIRAQENYSILAEEHNANTPSRKGMRKTDVTADMIEIMIKLYMEGYPYKDVAQILKVSPTTVSKYVQGNLYFAKIEEAHIKNNKGRNAIITDDKIWLMQSLYRLGKTAVEISSILGCSDVTVAEYLKARENWKEIQEEHLKNYNGPLSIITEEKIKQMESMYKAGKTCKQIADYLNCNISTVMQNLKLLPEWNNIKSSFVENYSGNKIRLPEKTLLKLLELAKQGKTSKEIADILGCSYSTVRKYIRDYEG